MNIYDAVHAEHERIKILLGELRDTSERWSSERISLLHQLKRALLPFTRAEQLVLYDQLKLCGPESVVDAAFEAHAEQTLIERLVADLEHCDPTNRRWSAMMKLLDGAVRRQFDNEEASLFAAARGVFRDEDAEAMAVDFSVLKSQYEQEFSAYPAARAGHDVSAMPPAPTALGKTTLADYRHDVWLCSRLQPA